MTKFEHTLSRFLDKTFVFSHMHPEEMAAAITQFVLEQGGDGDCVVFARNVTKDEIVKELLSIFCWQVARKEDGTITLEHDQEFIVIQDYGKIMDLPSWISGIFIC